MFTMGTGEFKSRVDGVKTRAYVTWSSMKRRCYVSNAVKDKSYKTCEVSDEWKNFQNFAKWFNDNVTDFCNSIDKDCLVYGNLVYSADTCVMMPMEINAKLNKLVGKSGVKRAPTGFISKVGFGKKDCYLGFYSSYSMASMVYHYKKSELIINMAYENKTKLGSKAFCALLEVARRLYETAEQIRLNSAECMELLPDSSGRIYRANDTCSTIQKTWNDIVPVWSTEKDN